MARRHTTPGWGQPTPGWAQAFPGWDPLPDPSPLPLRAAGSLRRWWWPTSAVAGFLAVVGYVFRHDDPRPGLSDRGWLTVVLAAGVVVLLTAHRTGRGRLPRAPLARAMAEYAVVALLAGLLATAGGQQPAERADTSADHRRPGIVRVMTGVRDWLADLWHAASDQTDRSTAPPSTTTPKEGR